MIDWSFAIDGAFMVDGFKQEVPVFRVDYMNITLPISSQDFICGI